MRPLLGAGVCFLLLRIAVWLLWPIVSFFGGQMVADTVGMLVAATVSAALALAIFESRKIADLGLDWRAGSGRNLLVGVGLGAGGAALLIAVPVALGMGHFRAVPHPDISVAGALFLPALLLCGALGEEIAFRGFVLQYLMKGWGAWPAIVAVGALFGWLHNVNPGATLLGDVNTALFGVLFGGALLRSRDLWLPTGMHFGWNTALPFLGAGLSGRTIRVTGYELVWTAGDLWSGGEYGPEASVLTSAVLVVLALAVWKIPVRPGCLPLLEEAPVVG